MMSYFPKHFSVTMAGLCLALLVSCQQGEKKESKPDSESKGVSVESESAEVGKLPASGEIAVVPPKGDNKEGGVQRPLTDKEKSKVIDDIIQTRARQQAAGLGRGKVTVNGAWEYVGYSSLSPNPDSAIPARLVAVDLTVENHTPYFDLDDIEIVDGGTQLSYGSDPDATPLDVTTGKPLPEDVRPPAAPAAGRWLLIYAFPKKQETFYLHYWNQNLTPEPITIGPDGLALPAPQTGL